MSRLSGCHQACRIKGEMAGIQEVAHFSLYMDSPQPPSRCWPLVWSGKRNKRLTAALLMCYILGLVTGVFMVCAKFMIQYEAGALSSASAHIQLFLILVSVLIFLPMCPTGTSPRKHSFYCPCCCFWVSHSCWILLLLQKEMGKFLGYLGLPLNLRDFVFKWLRS